MHGVAHELRFALRSLVRTPAFTAAAILTLAIGIGANAAIFSVLNAVVLKPAPFPDADRLVVFMTNEPGGSTRNASPSKFYHWRQQTQVVTGVAAFRDTVVNYTGRRLPQQLRAGVVSADYFRLLGAQAIRGRTFAPAEDLPGGDRVAVLSYGLWTTRFAADPNVVGTSMLLSGEPHTVIGIIGRGFHVEEFGADADVWVPFQLDPNAEDHGHYFTVAGRLKPGITLEQADARLMQSSADFRRRFPDWLGDHVSFGVTPFQDAFVGEARQTLYVLTGAVFFVLLIACANVASLLLARATGRRREMAIRTALGAGRGRIVRQLLTESLMLSVAGGALGAALGFAGIRAMLAVNTAGLPRIGQDGSLVSMDWRVLGFAAVVSVGTGILFGLAPGIQLANATPGDTLKENGGRSTTGFRQNKSRSLLVVAQMALALILLVGSSLLIRTLLALGAVNPGFDATNVLTLRVSLTGSQFQQTSGVTRLIREGRARLLALPGVEEASATCCLPLEEDFTLPFTVVGRPLGNDLYHSAGSWSGVADGYFEVFKVPIRRGRAFAESDTAQSQPVAIVNETLARQLWKDGDPLRDRLIIGRGIMPQFDSEPDRQIVGIVADSRDERLDESPIPKVFVPQSQVPDAFNALYVGTTPMAWVVRTRVPPYSISAAVQEQLRLASGLPLSDVRTMADVMSRSTSRASFNMLLMTMFALCSLMLAAIGIYGLIAYSVQQRTQEIGIRMALGAHSGDVRSMVVMQGMRLALAGIVLGMVLSAALARVMSGFLYGVAPHDPAVFVAIPVVLGVVALIAVWLPARRAARVDPLVALRYE